MHDYVIAPSLLAADFARLGEEADAVLTAGADMLHFDVMDNHFVPNLTVGPMVCEALRRFGIKAPIDVHLMVQPVDRLINDFAKAGATFITFHPEASENVSESLALIRRLGCKAGLSLNPESSVDLLKNYWEQLDLVLIMSVNPGFGGQSFIPSALEKLTQTRTLINASGRPIRLSIDGGIKVENIAATAKAGADTFVAGSAIFSQPSYANVIAEMRNQLKSICI
ncbi:MAG: ribulose-phosphate 3-epimerase [Gammaproteobacteria bacterium]|nr:ribulose-phosphate 3-epimerase [Gammaproteobacteria bacterium]